MRVISGKYKGRKLDGFTINGTRPTMDRVKMSLFGIIQDYISNSIVLDLFAGSGALGIEALSEGAKHVYFVDNRGWEIRCHDIRARALVCVGFGTRPCEFAC